MHTLPSLMNELHISAWPECFSTLFETAMADYEAGQPYLTGEFLARLDDEYGILPQYRGLLIETAKNIRAIEPLARYVALLRRMSMNPQYNHLINSLEFPQAPCEALEETYRLASIYAHLSRIEEEILDMRRRGVPEEIIHKSMSSLALSIGAYKLRFGYHGYNETYFNWNQHKVNGCDLLRIGSLNFEMHRGFRGNATVFRRNDGECRVLMNDVTVHRSGQLLGSAGYTDEAGSYRAEIIERDDVYEGYATDPQTALVIPQKVCLSKREWHIALRPTDNTLNVHIPRATDLSREALDATYREALEIIARCYPEFQPKAFTCYSWLMDPQLATLLRPGANIITFQSQFMRFPAKSAGQAVFSFLFVDSRIKRIEDQPENTSLERAVKKHYMDGRFIYEQSGVFLID